jgi:PmbA protein
MTDWHTTFEFTAECALESAKRAGATAAKVTITEMDAMSVSVRGRLPTERTYSQTSQIQLTLMRGQRLASVTSTDFSASAIDALVQRGIAIADVAAEDSAVGLPNLEDYTSSIVDCDLDHPWRLNMQEAVGIATEIEGGALSVGALVPQIEGANLNTVGIRSCLATSDGFLQSTASTRHSLSCMAVAMKDNQKEVDHWWSSARHSDDIGSPEAIGRLAAMRAVRRLDARQLPTQSCAVIFEPLAAASLIREFIAAISPGPLYTNASFMAGAQGDKCFASHVHVTDDPFVKRGDRSGSFDTMGIGLTRRRIVDAGVLQGYFLGLYGARRLGLPVSEHGSGPSNLTVLSSTTRENDDFASMLNRLGTGLVVSDMAGHGVNLMTGDISRAAQGFWVENGEIQYPVAGIAVASNLRDVFAGIQAIGSDTLTRSGITTGSWLVDNMRIGGA